ncbi:MAG: transcription elongation factor GreA [bacterium]|nr:transcription elongation factor GreA [bacterium]
MKYYLTAEKLEEFKQELNELKTVKRAEVADRLKKAKELGDLSENSEYFEAREEQGQVEGRVFELEEMIKNASVIIKATNNETVQIGSTIEVSKDGKSSKFTIVGSNETRPEAGLLSNESPLGKAFFGKKLGEQVKVKTPSGEVAYKIVNIE